MTIRFLNGQVLTSEMLNFAFDNKLDANAGAEIERRVEATETLLAPVFEQGFVDTFIKTEDGRTQDQINAITIQTVESITKLLSIKAPRNNQTLYVKGYNPATNFALAQPYRGGGTFIYDASQASIYNGVTIFNGWLRIIENNHYCFEMAGAYGDGMHDDTAAINQFFQALCPYPTGDNIIGKANVENVARYCNKYIVDIIGLYLTSDTIFIPSGFTLKQAPDGIELRKLGRGILYKPSADKYDHPAISTLGYLCTDSSNTDSSKWTYKLITDIYYTPTTSSPFIANGWNVYFDGLTVLCDKNVTLGVFLNGFFGAIYKLTVGHDYGGLMPKVGIRMNFGWNNNFDSLHITASVQPLVIDGVSTFNTVINPTCNGRYPSGTATRNIVPIYKDASMTENGSIGITLMNTRVLLIAPCYQYTVHGIAYYNSFVQIDFPYFESSIAKYEHYCIDSHVMVRTKSTLGYFGGGQITDADGTTYPFARSGVYVKNQALGGRKFKVSGPLEDTYTTIVAGENSPRSVILDVLSAGTSHKNFGDWSLVLTSNYAKLFGTSYIYIDPAHPNASDDNSGLTATYPLKTFAPVYELARANELLSNTQILLNSSMTLTADLDLSLMRKVTIIFNKTGIELNVGDYNIILAAETDFSINKASSSYVNTLTCTGTNGAIFKTSMSKYQSPARLNIDIACDINATSKLLLNQLALKNHEISIGINNNSTTLNYLYNEPNGYANRVNLSYQATSGVLTAPVQSFGSTSATKYTMLTDTARSNGNYTFSADTPIAAGATIYVTVNRNYTTRGAVFVVNSSYANDNLAYMETSVAVSANLTSVKSKVAITNTSASTITIPNGTVLTVKQV